MTGQAAAVEAALATGTLRCPSAAAPSFVDLVNAVHGGAGSPVAPTPHSAALAEYLFDRDHLVIVLVDGMGMSILDDPSYADLRGRVRMELDSVFPATTACAMTTVATGLWPAQHGIPGWWAYLDERDLAVTVLPFIERSSGRRLGRYGVQPTELWPEPPRFAGVTGDMEMNVPFVYVWSTFSRYLSGRCRTHGYWSLNQARRHILQRARRLHRRGGAAGRPALTYWYIPHYDGACHKHGVAGGHSRAVLAELQEMLLELSEALPDDSRMVLTADHGLIDLQQDQWVPIFDGDPLLKCLRTVPSGEGRTPQLHVNPGKGPELIERLSDQCGDQLSVLSQEEAESLGLFGPEPLSGHARRMFGDYIGIAIEPVSVGYFKSAESFARKHIGVHGGMTLAEVRIPLIVL